MTTAMINGDLAACKLIDGPTTAWPKVERSDVLDALFQLLSEKSPAKPSQGADSSKQEAAPPQIPSVRVEQVVERLGAPDDTSVTFAVEAAMNALTKEKWLYLIGPWIVPQPLLLCEADAAQ